MADLGEIEIIIPFKTPTINHLYWHRGNVKIMKSEAKKLRDDIFDIVVEKLPHNLSKRELRVVTEIHEDWYNKGNGLVKKKDVANREKFLIDSVFRALQIDDCYIFEHVLIKKNSKKEFCKMIITPL